MLKTYSTKGNTCIVPFAIKTPVSTFSFTANFVGGDAFGMNGRSRRATYRTGNAMEQYAIEESDMFKKGIVTLDDAVDTPAEAAAKAKAAARKMAKESAPEQEVNEELEALASGKEYTKKKK